MKPTIDRFAIRLFVAAGALGILASPGAVRGVTPDQIVSFIFHETPTDPNSDVIFTVELSLSAAETEGNSVGWEITQARLVEPLEGEGETVWVDAEPNVNTADGLWWIEHSDPESPQASEFVEPPLIDGQAEDPDGVDLNYTFEGFPYSPPPEGPPYTTTASIAFEHWLVGQSEPGGDPVAVPTEVERYQDPPIGS